MNIKPTVVTVFLGIVGGGAVFAWQGHSHEQQGRKAAQISGLVVDVACFVGHDSSGPKHAKCAEACARAGNPLAIYDEATKTLYLPVSLDHKNPNTKLMKYIETKVKVTGAIMEKGGLKGIAIERVEAAQ